MAATDVYTQAVALLEACQDLLGDRAPTLAYVSPGLPAFDCCPMLTVHVPSINEGPTATGLGGLASGHRYETSRINLISYVVSIIRCDKQQAQGKPPNPADKESTANETLQDIWTLWCGLNRMSNDGVLFHGCGERFFDGAQAIDPQGGCAGWLIAIRVYIPGYDPTE